jgi:hypothetical protein
MVLIEDGKGTGIKASVNRAHQLNVNAITNPYLQYESEFNGNAFSWSTDNLTPDASDTVILLKNTHLGLLHIDRITMSLSVADVITVFIPTNNITPTGTAIVGVNANIGNGNIAEAVVVSQESTNVGGDTIAVLFIGANTPYVHDVRGLFLDKNQSLAVSINTGTAPMCVTIMGHYLGI